MSKRYDKPVMSEQLAQLPDEDIDINDIPELDEAFWTNAKLLTPRTKLNVSPRVSHEVVELFKAENPKGYTARMAAVLVAYASAHQEVEQSEVQ